jgi:hypothetical protein
MRLYDEHIDESSPNQESADRSDGWLTSILLAITAIVIYVMLLDGTIVFPQG